MSSRSRRLIAAFSACAALGVMTALPAAAMPPDPWAPAGYFPPGCSTVVLNPYSVTYTDTTVPTLASLEFTVDGVRAGRTLVVGPNGLSHVGVVGRVTSGCSGVGPAWFTPSYGAGYLYLRASIGATNITRPVVLTHTGPVNSWNDLFDAPYDALGRGTPTIAGGIGARVQPLFWLAAERYTTFELNMDGELITSTDTSAATSVSASNLPALQVLRQTLLSATYSTRSVTAGRSIAVSGFLRMAESHAWAPLSGRVSLQRKIGTAAWKSIASATSSSAGRVSFSTVVSRSASYRLVYGGNSAAGLRAAAASNSAPVSVVAR